jgi:hypothetical protein
MDAERDSKNCPITKTERSLVLEKLQGRLMLHD